MLPTVEYHTRDSADFDVIWIEAFPRALDIPSIYATQIAQTLFNRTQRDCPILTRSRQAFALNFRTISRELLSVPGPFERVPVSNPSDMNLSSNFSAILCGNLGGELS